MLEQKTFEKFLEDFEQLERAAGVLKRALAKGDSTELRAAIDAFEQGAGNPANIARLNKLLEEYSRPATRVEIAASLSPK